MRVITSLIFDGQQKLTLKTRRTKETRRVRKLCMLADLVVLNKTDVARYGARDRRRVVIKWKHRNTVILCTFVRVGVGLASVLMIVIIVSSSLSQSFCCKDPPIIV